ncbi:MAG: hypothetical protein K2X35_10170 [Bryobacteraceae bacterium]|nr:hypothetical protein [Bryobacteraceae bacterium]
MAGELSRLVLPKAMLRRLDSAGIYCQTWVTVERQTRADRWVLRGVESGGANREVGRYISFFAPDGKQLAWLQKLDRIGGNGAHSVAVATEFVSVEIARVEQTYQVLIAKHRLGKAEQGRRPKAESTILFHGIDGHLPADLLKQGLSPEFFTRGGEVRPIPAEFRQAVQFVVAGVNCANCRHSHGLVAATAEPEKQQVVSIAS